MAKTKTPCPNCSRPTPTAELRLYSGICKYCKTSFKTAHRTWIRGTETSHERELEGVREHEVKPHTDFEDDHITSAIEFDYDAVDRELAGIKSEPEDAQARAAALVATIFSWVWSGPSLRSALLKFAVITNAMCPHHLGRSGADVARELKCTKQNFSKCLLRAETLFGVKLAGTRSAKARQNMRAARLRQLDGKTQGKRDAKS